MIEPTLYSYIKDSNSAKQVWDGICQAFDDSGNVRKVTIMQELTSVKLTNFSNTEKYINEILLHWNKSKIAGFKPIEQVIASLMLSGLPEEYRPMIFGIENSAKELTVDYVKTVLLQRIKDLILKRNEDEDGYYGKALAAKGVHKQCFRCGDNQHFVKNCPEVRRKCFKCSDSQHLIAECPEIKK